MISKADMIKEEIKDREVTQKLIKSVSSIENKLQGIEFQLQNISAHLMKLDGIEDSLGHLCCLERLGETNKQLDLLTDCCLAVLAHFNIKRY